MESLFVCLFTFCDANVLELAFFFYEAKSKTQLVLEKEKRKEETIQKCKK
jgi:hypothetical protein